MARQSSPGVAETHEVVVTGIATDGEGVARLDDGRVVFVTGALPGDHVVARVTSAKARIVFADTEHIIESSTRRVASVCVLDRCTGCPLKHFDYGAQCEAKSDQVLQAFTRIAKIDATSVFRELTAVVDPWHYRHRARLHARYDGQWRIGYFERGSHALVPISLCPVLWPELEGAVRSLGAWLAGKPRAWGVREIEIVYSRRDGRAAAEIYADGKVELVDAPFAMSCAAVRYGDVALRYDQPRSFDLMYEAGVFTQAHPAMNDKLVDAVLSATDGCARVLELHAGIGNFSLPLAAAGHIVRAVEVNPRSSSLANENALRAGLSIETLALPDAKAVRDADSYDVVVLDPPRVGAREVSQALAVCGPRRLVYVSCDPATLARDVQILAAGGYRLYALSAFDMFPLTPHVESLAVLTRAT